MPDPKAVTLAAFWLLAGGLTAIAQPGPAQPGQGAPPLPPAPPERIEPAPQTRRGGGPTGNDVVQEGTGVPRGVVRPPSGVDPGIHAPAPDPTPNTTPVIPPPGTPGGNPNVQPK